MDYPLDKGEQMTKTCIVIVNMDGTVSMGIECTEYDAMQTWGGIAADAERREIALPYEYRAGDIHCLALVHPRFVAEKRAKNEYPFKDIQVKVEEWLKQP